MKTAGATRTMSDAKHRGCGGNLVRVGNATIHSATVPLFRCDKCHREYDISDQVFDWPVEE